jgi:hypothetical protein
MIWLYSIAILLGSFLLFLVQPICAKSLLPLVGGTPAAWNTCVVFFQAALLAGYAYAHVLPNRLGVGRHAILHVAGLIGVCFLLPITLPEEVREGWHPVLWLLVSLTASAGLPVFFLASGAPLLQRWMAHRHGADPYVLYAASNLGSFLALAVFPFVLEPYLPIDEQNRLWKFGFFGLTALMAICIPFRAMSANPATTSPIKPAPTWWQRGRWIALALIPSSLLLSVTTHLTTDVAAIPLLWLIPMALYLLTFTIVFARKDLIPPAQLRRWLPLVVIVILLVMLSESTEPLFLVMAVHLIGFFWLALLCHGELARTRPAATHLTDFYLCLATGGVLGGALSALVAPLIFSGFVEYPMMILLACAFGIGVAQWPTRQDWLVAAGIGLGTAAVIVVMQRDEFVVAGLGKLALVPMVALPLLICYLLQKQPARFVLSIAAVVIAGSLMNGPHGRVIYRERSYFGVHRVTRQDDMHHLIHGNIAHGRQSLELDRRLEPLTYYSTNGPIGDVFRAYRGDPRLKKVGLVGLGTGSLASYSQAGDDWTFFEIDPSVKRIAENRKLFTFVGDAQGKIKIELGDGRLLLKHSKDQFGLLVIDAFGSDAIPLHLLTREAFALYLERLQPNGLLAFHISNRYVDLEPPIANLAADTKPPCVAWIREDLVVSDDEKVQGISPSIWMVVAQHEEDLTPLTKAGQWRRADAHPQQRVWTDDFSNLRQVFRWRAAD